MSALQPYQTELIEHAMAIGALKFGSFTLKSGRYAPSSRKICWVPYQVLLSPGSRLTSLMRAL
jgi:hypothetical protein